MPVHHMALVPGLLGLSGLELFPGGVHEAGDAKDPNRRAAAQLTFE